MENDTRWKNVWASVTEAPNPFDRGAPTLEYCLEVDGYFVRSYHPKWNMMVFVGENLDKLIFEQLIHRMVDQLLLSGYDGKPALGEV